MGGSGGRKGQSRVFAEDVALFSRPFSLMG